MRRVERFSPESLDEVAALLLAVEGEGAARMHGAALVVESEEAEGRLAIVLDLSRVPELNRFEFDERLGLRLGAAVPLREVSAFRPARTYAILTDGLEPFASSEGWEGSLGELLGRPERAGHLACPLICLRASTAVFGPHGWSEMGFEALFATSAAPALQPREFVVDLRLPPPPPRSSGAYVWRGLDGEAEAACGAAAFLVMEEDWRTCCGARLGLWSGRHAPARVLEAERFLAGKRLDERIIAEAEILADDPCALPPPARPPLAEAIRRAAERLPAPRP